MRTGHRVCLAVILQLTPFDPDFAEALDDAQALMRKYPNAMKALAE
jgi:hypothetical protein